MAYASLSVRRQVGKHVFLNDEVVLRIYSALGKLFSLRTMIERGKKNGEAERKVGAYRQVSLSWIKFVDTKQQDSLTSFII